MKTAVLIQCPNNATDIKKRYTATYFDFDYANDNDDALYFVGFAGHSYGLYGNSTKDFTECTTTTPLTEIADKMGLTLIYPDNTPVPRYL